jgi:hypothetical protein
VIKKKQKQPKRMQDRFDKKWMKRLLSEPEVAEEVEKMTAMELEFFKQMLVKQGTYRRYVTEQQKEQVKQAAREQFPNLIRN